MSRFEALALLGLLTAPAAAFWRMPCKSPIVVERLDPIVSPGQVSNHLHTIMGGNGFAPTMNYNSTQASTCSSCTVIGDNSNYWTPTVWYAAEDGTFESVNQIGGATVYYLQRGAQGEKLEAFPPGFRMISGDPFKRTAGTDFASQAISYNCLGTSNPETGGFPNYNCPSGLRTQVFFPSCWNGRDLDSPDHKSHVSFPANDYNNGPCPADFPHHLISIFYEIVWDTNAFAGRWYGNKQPFVFSQGDPTGYGGHGDFVMGWEHDHLQRAVDTCTNLSGRVEDCPEFRLIPDSQAEGCSVPPVVNEVVSGKLSALPGCNPVQQPPNRATVQTGCGATTAISQSTQTPFKDLTGQGWAYAGCGTDNYFNRILTGASTNGNTMTNDQCVAFCTSKGFSVAGSEYAKECYCGNSIPDLGAPVPGVPGNCKMPCAGDSTQMCGGAGTISLYTKCSGSACTNANFGAPAPKINAASSASSPTAVSSVTTPTTVATPSPSSIPASSPSPSPVSPGSGSPGSSDGSDNPYPLPATPAASSPVTPTPALPTATSIPTRNLTLPPSWTYSGCYVDTVFPRSLPIWSNFNGPSMSNLACATFCDTKGFKISGTEYAGQCFCGNALVESSQASESDCNTPCTGAAAEMCGGPARLSVSAKTGAWKARRHSDAHLGKRHGRTLH